MQILRAHMLYGIIPIAKEPNLNSFVKRAHESEHVIIVKITHLNITIIHNSSSHNISAPF